MAIDNSKIILGLPNLPPDTLPPWAFSALLPIHTAIKNLADLVSQYTGIDAPDSSEWAATPASATILTGNATRLYPVADVAINPGQLVNLFNSGGVVKARLASASSAATMAHGIANTAGVPGSNFEMQWLRCFTQLIGGMTPGTLYYVSTTPGAVQSAAPVAGGTIRQPAGLALAASQLILDLPLSFIQN